MKKIFVLLLIVVPVIVLFLYGLGRDPRILPSALIQKPAPTFSLLTLDGKTMTLEELKGKPIVLNFWSTWCGPCLDEHRVIMSARTQFPDVQFLAVLYEDTPENARAFLKKFGVGSTVLIDEHLKTAIDYGVAGVPETYFIDAHGIIADKHAGVLTPRILEEKLSWLERAVDTEVVPDLPHPNPPLTKGREKKMTGPAGSVADIQSRMEYLGSMLRCPVCRGVPIADSPSEMAKQMMGQIREFVQSGKSDEEILSYFVARYGEWVLLKPKPRQHLLVWILPFLFLIGGGGILYFKLRKERT
ncbi:MAG: cytochrome c-type biogenesis protein CcmH [Deltaproteobacteria bacterium]|nr:cytochrome c-type biogenesis protein CcmH [Deltaproteobacteria bacterium]